MKKMFSLLLQGLLKDNVPSPRGTAIQTCGNVKLKITKKSFKCPFSYHMLMWVQ